MLPHERLDAALQTIGWSTRELARRLDHANTTSRQMRSGRRHVPDNLLNWIEPMADEISRIDWPVISAATEQSDLTPDDLSELMTSIGWDFDEAAVRLAAGDRPATARYLDGRWPMPAVCVAYLQAVAAAISAHPARPPGWGAPGRHQKTA